MNSKTKQLLTPLVLALVVTLGLLELLGTELWQMGKPMVAWAQSQVRYVAPGGNCGGANPCYATIQAAVNAASAGDTIKIAQGVYTSEALQVVYINKAITLIGGYTTSDWNHSDPLNRPTVVDAENAPRRRGVYIDGTGVGAITVEGLTVERGYTQDSDGGGVYVNNGTVTLSKNTIQKNSSGGWPGGGGGVCVNNGTVTLSGNTIQNNSADAYSGGGIYVNSGVVTLSGNTILNNSAFWGGGVYIGGGITTLNNNIIQGDSARLGGGVCIEGGTVTLQRNIIRSNSASYEGGGVRISSFDDSAVIINGNTIQNNSAGDDGGGGVSIGSYGDSAIIMSGNSILDNTANGSGGGIMLDYGTVNAQNDIIANNASLWEGVYISGGTLTARHWTLADNGKYALTTNRGSANLTNVIVASHTLAGFWGTSIVADHALYYNNGTPCGGGASCTNNLSGDPRFVNPSARDYHIGSGSAAIDQGVDVGVATDVDGDSRPQGVAPDLGADEMTSSPSPLRIRKVGPASADAGDLITYTLTISNRGSQMISNLVISDVVPTGASFVKALEGGQLVSGGVVRWAVPSLAVGSSTSPRFVVTATQTIINNDYRVNADGGFSAIGDGAVVTIVGGQEVYLPIILRNQ